MKIKKLKDIYKDKITDITIEQEHNIFDKNFDKIEIYLTKKFRDSINLNGHIEIKVWEKRRFIVRIWDEATKKTKKNFPQEKYTGQLFAVQEFLFIQAKYNDIKITDDTVKFFEDISTHIETEYF